MLYLQSPWNNTIIQPNKYFLLEQVFFESGANYVAYCFLEKMIYSKFGSYIGNGNADGTFIYTGLKPLLLLEKTRY